MLVILLPLSYSVVQLNEYALYHSRWSEVLTYDSTMTESGRYFTGLPGELITFPRTKNLIEFKEGYDGTEKGLTKGGGNTLRTWTNDGANVYLEASFYISLNKDKLLSLYTEYGALWLGFLVRLSFSVLKSTTVSYSTNDFVSNSQGVSAAMKDNLSAAFTSNFSGAINMDSFYLQKVSFDGVLDDSINSKLVQAHRKKSYTYQNTILTTRKQTELAVLSIDNDIRVTMATSGDGPASTYEYEQLGLKIDSLSKAMALAYTTMNTALAGGAAGAVPVVPYSTTTDIWKYFYVTELKIARAFSNVTFLDASVMKNLPVYN